MKLTTVNLTIYVFRKILFLVSFTCFCTGTKHIDPDTGLIYFKYDFGYEFGVILPGEGKCNQKKSQMLDKKEEGSIDFPVIHEKTVPKKNSPEMKTVKWEQTSESEMSDIECESHRKRQTQHEPHISVLLSTPSPQSLSPSIQSLSPYSAGYDSTGSFVFLANLIFTTKFTGNLIFYLGM